MTSPNEKYERMHDHLLANRVEAMRLRYKLTDDEFSHFAPRIADLVRRGPFTYGTALDVIERELHAARQSRLRRFRFALDRFAALHLRALNRGLRRINDRLRVHNERRR